MGNNRLYAHNLARCSDSQSQVLRDFLLHRKETFNRFAFGMSVGGEEKFRLGEIDRSAAVGRVHFQMRTR